VSTLQEFAGREIGQSILTGEQWLSENTSTENFAGFNRAFDLMEETPFRHFTSDRT
jgi:hypothetical protein